MKTDYLRLIGVNALPRTIVPFDPGYDHNTFIGHVKQSFHLMKAFKISMSTWMVCNDDTLKFKINSLRKFNIPIVAGGGPFEIANYYNKIEEYFKLCASTGFNIIEIGQGFSKTILNHKKIMTLATQNNLQIQYEIGHKYKGAFTATTLKQAVKEGKKWIENGANHIVVEALESAIDVGLFDKQGILHRRFADQLIKSFNYDFSILQFEAPNKSSQFQLMNHFGSNAILSNVRLEEILRVAIYNIGLHSKSFNKMKS